jgi:hypothetical protein
VILSVDSVMRKKTFIIFFFLRAAAKYMWDVVSSSVGAQTRPGYFTQYFHQIAKFAKGLSHIHVVGLCWAMWN